MRFRARRPAAASLELIGAPAPRRALLVCALALIPLLLGACRLELDVNVSVEEDGSGSLEVVTTLDAEALDRVGGDLGEVVELDDLRAAGWTVDGPSEEADGRARLAVRRAFGNPEEAAAVFDELNGEDGPFRRFRVRHDTSFARTEWGFSGQIDFSGGIEALGDERLAEELDGEPVGLSAEELEERLGDPLSRLVEVRVRVDLPGEMASNAPIRADNGAEWQVGFGERAVDLEAEGTERRLAPIVLAVVAAVLGSALVVGLFVRLAMRVTDRRRPEPAEGDTGP